MPRTLIDSDYRTARLREPEPRLRGLDVWAHAWQGWRARRRLGRERWLAETTEVLAAVAELRGASEDTLRAELAELRVGWRRGGAGRRAALRARALAAVAETARRTLGLTPHPVQLGAALGLDDGVLIELATGEGKSLAAALAAVLAGWTGEPCHVVTVNDYLAERDASGFRRFYEACGVRVGWVEAGQAPAERRAGYAADVTYVTSKELLADFLRDRLALGEITEPERRFLRGHRGGVAKPRPVGCVMRGLGAAIVDEADSVLIDEAVTPLIISRARPDEDLRVACGVAVACADELEEEVDFCADRKRKEVRLTPAGRRRLAEQGGGAKRFPLMWRGEIRREELVERALEARVFFQRGRHYEVQDGKVVIVDEFTGRLMPGRSWRDGLHQAIEAREGLAITPPTETVARMSFQRFFRLFPRLAGTTGTAWEARRELWRVYRLAVVRLPTHRPRMLTWHRPEISATSGEKTDAIVAEVKRARAADRAVLVGLRSVAESEALSARLEREGVPHQVLNALRHREEAEIVRLAGGVGRVTLATNMAGRGTDVRLDPVVAAAGGLLVLGTELHESARVDRQLAGRAGRQGDPGEAKFFLSIEDELARRYWPGGLRRVLAHLGLGAWMLRRAQIWAERQATISRHRVQMNDEWLEVSLALTGRRAG
jgi:preprotein translocase subunit SecA